MEMSKLCGYAKKSSWKKNLRLKWDMSPSPVVLHTALLSELSTAGSWANGNSFLYPVLSE